MVIVLLSTTIIELEVITVRGVRWPLSLHLHDANAQKLLNKLAHARAKWP